MITRLHNIFLALKDQGPFWRFVRNLKRGNLIGLFSKRSHFRDTGSPKVMYNTKRSAEKAAAAMTRKTGNYFCNYKCIRCSGFHIGKNKSKV